MKKLKIGFVGAGWMGQNAHMFNYAALQKECEIVALAEPRAKLAAKVAGSYGIPRMYANHEELLASEKLDAVIASQPYRRHSILVPDILRAGVPVFTEKPLTLTVEAGEKLAAIGKELGVLHAVGYHKRSDPAIEYAKNIIDEWKTSGEYGSMRYVRVTMPPGDWINGVDRPIGSDEPYVTFEQEPDPVGMTLQEAKEYDIFVNFYIHQVNLIRHMLGEPYRFAFASRSGVLMTGESASGVCVALEMATFANTTEWYESVLVTFEKGYVKVVIPAPLARQRAGKVTVMRDNGKDLPTLTEPIMPNMGAMRKQAINFLAAVRGERPAPCTAEEAVEDLKIAKDFIQFMSAYKKVTPIS